MQQITINADKVKMHLCHLYLVFCARISCFHLQLCIQLKSIRICDKINVDLNVTSVLNAVHINKLIK